MFDIICDRYRTSDVCHIPGHYEFDGYLDGASDLLPDLEDMEIRLGYGELFPAVSRAQRPCFWKIAGLPALLDDALVGEVVVT